MTSVAARVWRGGEMVARRLEMDDLDRWLATPDALVWVDLCDPDPADLARLAEELRLDAPAVEDAVAEGERVKLSRHPGHLFCTMYASRIVVGDDPEHRSNLVTSQVSAFVMPRGLITVRSDDGFDMADVLQSWADNADLLQDGVFALFHGLLDTIIDGHSATVDMLEGEITTLEDQVFAEAVPGRQVQQRIYRLRRELVDLRRIIVPLREVVLGIVRRRLPASADAEHAPPSFPEGTLAGWYDDLYDHVVRACEDTESLRDMVGGLFDTHLSLQNTRLNTVMKKLAGWAAVIAVPTAVTGWFGQNVPYPGSEQMSGLWMSVGLIVVGTIGLYALFRRHDWI